MVFGFQFLDTGLSYCPNSTLCNVKHCNERRAKGWKQRNTNLPKISVVLNFFFAVFCRTKKYRIILCSWTLSWHSSLVLYVETEVPYCTLSRAVVQTCSESPLAIGRPKRIVCFHLRHDPRVMEKYGSHLLFGLFPSKPWITYGTNKFWLFMDATYNFDKKFLFWEALLPKQTKMNLWISLVRSYQVSEISVTESALGVFICRKGFFLQPHRVAKCQFFYTD